MLATLRRYGRNAQWRVRRGAEAAGFAGMGSAAFVQGNRDRRAGLRKVGPYQLKSRLRKPKRTIKSRANTGKAGASTKRRTYKRKRKSGGREFAKRVRAVISKTVPQGTYRKVEFGELCMPDVLAHTAYSNKAFFGTKKKVAYTGLHTETFGKMVFFNYLKLMDAASVCYNGKSTATGWPTTTQNFDVNLETRFLYASASLEMKNMTSEPFDVTVHECTAKKNTNTTPLSAFNEVKADTAGSNPSLTLYDSSNNMRVERAVKFPSDYKPSDWTFKSKKYIQVMPGQVISWTMSKKDFNVDFNKLIDPALGIVMYSKGAVQVLFEFTPRVATFSKTTATANLAVQSGGISSQPIDVTFAVTQKEFYKLDQPGNTLDANEGNKVYLYADTDLNGLTVDRKYMIEIENANTYSVANPVV